MDEVEQPGHFQNGEVATRELCNPAVLTIRIDRIMTMHALAGRLGCRLPSACPKIGVPSRTTHVRTALPSLKPSSRPQGDSDMRMRLQACSEMLLPVPVHRPRVHFRGEALASLSVFQPLLYAFWFLAVSTTSRAYSTRVMASASLVILLLCPRHAITPAVYASLPCSRQCSPTWFDKKDIRRMSGRFNLVALSLQADQIKEKNSENPVMVYSKTYCPYCGQVSVLE